MVIKWKDEYSCYDAEIDKQHMKLIELINQMNELRMLDDGYDRYDEIVAVFKELQDYAVYHFGHEEKICEERGYDSFNTKIQKLEHGSFVKKVTSFNPYELDEDQSTAILNLLDFLSRWLDQHILVTDKRLGEFLKESGK